MILLDTDHLSLLTTPERSGATNLAARLRVTTEDVATSIVSVEEIMRGWLAVIAREKQVRRQTSASARLCGLFDFFSEWTLLPFDQQAAERFEQLQAARVRIGTMDLKIASIALVHDALLLTANRSDFEQVPGLKFENWLA